MKIALFHTTLPEPARKLGGVEVAVHRLANALCRLPDKHEITVFSVNGKPDDALYQHRKLFPQCPWLITDKYARAFLLPFLLNFVDFGRPDVLHLHGDDWFFVARKVPTVRTMHGSAIHEARSASTLLRKIFTTIVYPLEHLSASLAGRSLAVGTETADLYHADATADNGVDPNVFSPGSKTDHPSILYVGTWEGRKRGKFIFDLFLDRILPELPEATLCFVSDFCPDHPNVIKDVFPSDAVLAQRFREAWIFAYPSIYEGFGIPYLEAMASGTPIVCSPNSGAAYVLANYGRSAIVDDDFFADRILTLLRTPSARSESAAIGLERSRMFTWSAVAARHLQIYGDLVDETECSLTLTRKRSNPKELSIIVDSASDKQA